VVPGPPWTGPPSPAPGGDRPSDLNLADWQAAERRRAGPPAPPEVDLQLPGPTELVALPVPAGGRPKGRATRYGTRVWAALKMASFAYSTWWLVATAKVPLGTTICAYGLASFIAGLGARWRRRWFGPGQLLEPELYEEIGRWLYRLGTVLVLAGGALYIVRAVR
jgi:hypothetical protein